MRGTNAIGVFAKLAPKNPVNALLKQFRARYLSGQKISVAAQRQPLSRIRERGRPGRRAETMNLAVAEHRVK